MPLTVTLIMFAIYIAVVFVLLKKASTAKNLVLAIITLGVAFGMVSYSLAVSLSGLESVFMNNQWLQDVLIAPIQEEIVKFIGFYYILLTRLHLPDETVPKTGNSFVILGVFVGLVFALLENLSSYGNLTVKDTFIRTISAWPLHMVTTGISAHGFNTHRSTKDLKIILILTSLAIAIHIIFNLFMVVFAF